MVLKGDKISSLALSLVMGCTGLAAGNQQYTLHQVSSSRSYLAAAFVAAAVFVCLRHFILRRRKKDTEVLLDSLANIFFQFVVFFILAHSAIAYGNFDDLLFFFELIVGLGVGVLAWPFLNISKSIKKKFSAFFPLEATYEESCPKLSRKKDDDDAVESIVRKYKCTQLRFPKCTGYLTVTNRRVVFHGISKRKTQPTSRIVYEAYLDSISGSSAFYGRKFSLMALILGGGIGALGAALASTALDVVLTRYFRLPSLAYTGFMFALGGVAVMTGVGILLFNFCIKAFHLQIFSSNSDGSPISVGNGLGNFIGNLSLFSLVAKPTEETDHMLKELGSVIIDLKLNVSDLGE